MDYIQLTLDQYASWLELMQQYENSGVDKRNREYRRSVTFEKHMKEKLRQQLRHERTYVPKKTQRIYQSDTPLTKAMKQRHFSVAKRACTKAIPFDLTVEYLVTLAESTPTCAIFGTPLVYFGQGANAELDRTVPALGYTMGNVVFLSSKANRLKSDHTLETAQALVAYLSGMTN